MTVRLELAQVSLGFGGLEVLEDVSFAAHDGELLTVIGPNGAGKTSALNCINGVYRPSSGSIRLDGVELIGRRPAEIARLGVARTFQNLALFANLDLVDNLMLGRHHQMRTGFLAGAIWIGRARREERAHRERCHEIVDLLALGPYVGRPAGLLPYGVQKRVEFGRAVAMDPQVLLLDEPVAGMNNDETAEMAHFILQVRHELALTMVMIEHDMHLVVDLADRLVCLSFGKVLAQGSPDEVVDNRDVIEAYLGSGAGSS